MIDLEYKIACTEVLEILKYIPKEDYDKIPREIIEAMKLNKQKDYKFKYNIRKKFDEQDITTKAKTILAIFFRDYWATERQKEMILAKENADRNKLEQEKREKYNPDNIFKNSSKLELAEEDTNIQIIEYKKENILKKLLKKLKLIFNKKNKK